MLYMLKNVDRLIVLQSMTVTWDSKFNKKTSVKNIHCRMHIILVENEYTKHTIQTLKPRVSPKLSLLHFSFIATFNFVFS